LELPKENEYFHYKIVKGNFLWSQIFFPLYLFTHPRPNILFCPAHYAPRLSPVPTVVTIHDLAYFYYPDEFLKKDLYQLMNWTKYSIQKANKIIAVSKSTKDDIKKFYDIAESKIEVIYNGFRTSNETRFQNSKFEIPNAKYLLYVGTIQPRKNISNLLEGFKKVLVRYPDLKLYLVGRKGWLYESIFRKVEELNLKKNVIFTGYISNSHLDYLYKHAEAFILPSLYEGFGLPLLEAMSRNLPVLSSNTASLPEIGGNACLYFDPTSSEDIKDKIIELLTNRTLQQHLVKKGKERVQLFSWEKCGEETLKIIKSRI